MGLLSRKRRVPRIVKKTKTGKALGKKKISLGLVDPHIRVRIWFWGLLWYYRGIGILRSLFKRILINLD